MRKILIALAILLFPAAVLAQLSPGLVNGQVPTAAQWNSYFAAKQDVLGYRPVNVNGDIMLGRFVTFASTVTAAGFNVPPGVAPTVPINGDLWTTIGGLFVRVNGVTVPLIGASSGSFAATAPITIAFPSGVVTYGLNQSANYTWLGDHYFGSGRPWVDVRSKGAVGDGVTNDGPAIDAATAVAGPLGAILYFPPGKYCHFTGLTVSSPSVTLLGSAPNFTPGSGATPGSTLSACLHDVTTLTLTGIKDSVFNMTVEGDNALTTTHPAVVLGTNCTDCFMFHSESRFGTNPVSIQAADFILEDDRFIQGYGSGWIYVANSGGGHIIRTKANNSWQGCEPSAPATVNAWAASTSYAQCTVVTLGGWLIKATVAGTSASTSPTVQPFGTNITDNTVTWALQGAATNYGLQCDTGCNVLDIVLSDFSGAHTAGLAFTNSAAGTPPAPGTISATTSTDNLSNSLLASAGGGMIVQGARFSCIVTACQDVSFGASFTGPIQIDGTLVISQGTGISVLGGIADLANNGVFSTGATGISVATANPSIVGNNVGATAGFPTNATGIALTSAASNSRVLGNPCGGIAACLSDASAGPKVTEQNGSQWISANTSTTPASGVPGTYALRLTSADAATPRLLLEGYGTGITPIFLGLAARGTGVSPSALQSGDVLVNYGALGYGATQFGNGRIATRIVAAQNFTDTAQGTATDVLSTLSGGTTGAVVCRFENDGGITCPNTVTGGSLGAGKFNVSGGYFVGGNAVAMSATGALSLNSTTGALSCSTCSTAVGANPTANVGLSAVNGSSTNFMRADAAPALSQAIAPTWTGVHTYTLTQAANTSTDGIALADTTAASTGNQQFSPRLRLTGQGWKTTATAASQAVDWIIENQPVQGTTNPTPNLVFSAQVNGGGYVPALSLLSNNALVISQNSSGIPSVVTPGAGGAPGSLLVMADNTSGGYLVYTFGQQGANAFTRFDGTLASPTALQANDEIGRIAFSGYTGSALASNKSRINCFAAEIWSGTANGTYCGVGATMPTTTTESEVLRVHGNGHVLYDFSGVVPTMGSCGASPSAVSGNDMTGTFTTGSGVLTSCVMNFAKTWGTAPICTVSSPTAIASLTVAESTTALTIGGTSLTGTVIGYHCFSYGTSWLLERDLDPAANDNNPVGLARVG